jgi:hypothetical protein
MGSSRPRVARDRTATTAKSEEEKCDGNFTDENGQMVS